MEQLPELPQGITSFGAVIVDDCLYTYGGHHGRAHQYSIETQSDQLQRLNLRNPTGWATVATGPRLQGLAMDAHAGKVYRLGGFTAHNQPDEEDDLRSVDDFTSFDPETRSGRTMPRDVLMEGLRAAAGSDVVIHALDTSGLGGDTGEGPGGGQSTLHLMANETGGHHYENLNDLRPPLEEIIKEASSF